VRRAFGGFPLNENCSLRSGVAAAAKPSALNLVQQLFQPKELTMIAVMKENDRYEQYDDSAEVEKFERFTYRRGGEFPVRSHSAQTRGKLRSRSTAAGRRKARTFNGVNRRGTGRRYSKAPAFTF
jgi:hypothetical protein